MALSSMGLLQNEHSNIHNGNYIEKAFQIIRKTWSRGTEQKDKEECRKARENKGADKILNTIG